MKQIVMIGTPLGHALSPNFVNEKLRELRVDARVVKREMQESDLADFVSLCRTAADTIGLIVTTPLKQAICAHLDRRTDLVARIGAANCVRCRNGHWLGANFDGAGFVSALSSQTRLGPGMRILLVGCGGAGSAIAAELISAANIALSLFDSDAARPKNLAARLADLNTQSTITCPQTSEGSFDIVINASTLGMRDGDPSPIPEASLAITNVIADIIVGRETALKLQARRQRKILIEGEAVVMAQADCFVRFILGDAESEAQLLAE